MTIYSKPHLSFPDQVRLLQSRGMLIDDPAEAARTLSVVGYYRLSGYWYPYRRPLGPTHRDDRFVEGTTFATVARLYDADRRLKLHVLDAIERVEIALRVMIGFTLGRRGPYAHLIPGNLDGRFTHSEGRRPSRYDTWLSKVLDAQMRSSEDFVVHFQQKYDGRLPVWVVTEIMDFGATAHLFRGLKAADRNAIARELDVVDRTGLGNGFALGNWLQVLNYVRNICAHHSRLWNRRLVNKIASRHLVSIPQLGHLTRPDAPPYRIYPTLCVLAFLLERVGQGDWVTRLRDLLEVEVPACGRSLTEVGFPAGWGAQWPWKNGGGADGRDGVL